MTSARTRGGLMRVLETLAAHQSRLHEVTVVSPLPPQPQASLRLEWRQLHVPGNAHLGAVVRLLRAVRACRPDLVVHHAGAPGELALPVALLSVSLPVVVVEHLPEYEPLGTPGRDRVFAWLNRRAARWVSVSAAGAAALERRWRLRPGTIGVVHCGVEAPAPGVVDVGGECPAVLGVGRSEHRKGLDTFAAVAEALAPAHPEVRWWWLGADAAGRIGAVELLPWVAEVGPWLRRSALLLLPSRAEGLPLVVLEAMACGCPVVASRVGGVPEAVEDGVTGLLLPPGDTDSWVAAVDALLLDSARRVALGAAGRAAWQTRWTAEAMTARFAVLLAEVVRHAGSRLRVDRQPQ